MRGAGFSPAEGSAVLERVSAGGFGYCEEASA